MIASEGEILLSHVNETRTPLMIWIEPWAEGFEVKPGSSVKISLLGAPVELAEIDKSAQQVTIYAPSGSCVDVTIDGVRQDSASAKLTVPSTRRLSTRGFIDIAFGDSAEARPHGRARPAKGWRGWISKYVR